jgi:hypothetical protein
MRKYLLALISGALICAPLQAAVISFEYSGIVSIATTYANETVTWGSAEFGQSIIVEGNHVSGTISYDTDTARWFQRGGIDFYKGVGASTLKVLENGFAFASTSADVPQLQVGNNSASYRGYDHFGFASHTYANGSEPTYSLNFGLFDKTGSAFSSNLLPTHLELSQFHQSTVIAYYYAPGIESQFTADLISLNRANEIPEPASLALMLSFIVLIFSKRRRSHTAHS